MGNLILEENRSSANNTEKRQSSIHDPNRNLIVSHFQMIVSNKLQPHWWHDRQSYWVVSSLFHETPKRWGQEQRNEDEGSIVLMMKAMGSRCEWNSKIKEEMWYAEYVHSPYAPSTHEMHDCRSVAADLQVESPPSIAATHSKHPSTHEHARNTITSIYDDIDNLNWYIYIYIYYKDNDIKLSILCAKYKWYR